MLAIYCIVYTKPGELYEKVEFYVSDNFMKVVDKFNVEGIKINSIKRLKEPIIDGIIP